MLLKFVVSIELCILIIAEEFLLNKGIVLFWGGMTGFCKDSEMLFGILLVEVFKIKEFYFGY